MTLTRKKYNEICNECGDSVTFRSGKFINRIPDFNDIDTRKDMGRNFPEGDFVCRECDKRDEF